MLKRLFSDKKAANNSTEIVVIILSTVIIATLVFAGIKAITSGGIDDIKAKINEVGNFSNSSYTYDEFNGASNQDRIAECTVSGGAHNFRYFYDISDSYEVYECEDCEYLVVTNNNDIVATQEDNDRGGATVDYYDKELYELMLKDSKLSESDFDEDGYASNGFQWVKKF